MPSNRKDAQTYEMLESLKKCTNFTENQVEVLISDNSYCDKKRKFLDRCVEEGSNYFVTQGPPNAFDNHYHALKSCNGRYVLQLGDDDIIHSSAIAEILSCIKQNSKISLEGIFGPFEQHLEQGKVRTIDLQKLASDLLDDRVKSMCNAIPYGNPVFQMVWERKHYLNAYKFITTIPYSFYWHDHLMVLHALINGKFAEINRPFMSHNFENWTDEQRIIHETKYHLSKDAPKSLALVYRIILGFEGAQLIFNSTNDAHAASIWFKSWQKAFEVELGRYESQKSLFVDCPQFDTVTRFIDNLYVKGQLTLSNICDDIHNLYRAIFYENKDYRDYWMNCNQIT